MRFLLFAAGFFAISPLSSAAVFAWLRFRFLRHCYAVFSLSPAIFSLPPYAFLISSSASPFQFSLLKRFSEIAAFQAASRTPSFSYFARLSLSPACQLRCLFDMRGYFDVSSALKYPSDPTRVDTLRRRALFDKPATPFH